MQNQLKEIFGAWLAAIGTILTAIGSTPTIGLSSTTQRDLNFVGNALEAAGSALGTDGQGSPFSLEYMGNALSSIGSLETFAGVAIDFPQSTKTNISIQGNLIQALGSGIGALDEFYDNTE